jgi:tellurite resistance protein TerC
MIDPWLLFHVLIFIFLAMDLGIFNRKAHEIKIKEALGWSIFWMVLGVSFSGYVAWLYGRPRAMEYLSAYVVEKSLSVDNLFIFSLIFAAFKIPKRQQHRLLFWGVLGAIILRGIMIFSGTALIAQFHGLIIVFGAFLVYTGVKFAVDTESQMDPGNTFILRLARRIFPISDNETPQHFFERRDHRLLATKLFLALLAIESSDVIFALDSVPAVIGLSRNAYVVYTSNIFAILGLRSLFFVLENLLDEFWLLKKALSFILIYVGGKMLIEGWYTIPPLVNLAIILSSLVISVVLSKMIPKPHKSRKKTHPT